MFPKFNLSRFSSLAALGIIVAVLGGCAESTAGTATIQTPQTARLELTRASFENAPPRESVARLSVDVTADSHKVASRRATPFALVH